MESISLVAADDHKLFLEGLKSLFQLTSEQNLIETCEDGDTLLSLISKHRPDIALVDISMPGASTETIVQTVEAKFPNTKLIALTMHMDAKLVQNLIELGLSGYVLKDGAFDELGKAITDVKAGEQYISPKLMERISLFHEKVKKNKELLTIRETAVLSHAAEGNSNKQIARILEITERTVRFHLSNCCIKLQAHGRSNAVAIALKKKLLLF